MSNALQTYEAEKREFIYFYVQLAVQVGSFCVGYLLAKASREQLAFEQANPSAEEQPDAAATSDSGELGFYL